MGAPNLPVLVYDGGCGICTRMAHWVAHRLPEGNGAAVEPWQRLDLEALCLSAADVDSAAWWIDARSAKHRGHRAIAASLRAIGGRWGTVGRLLSVQPVSWLAAAVYAVVAPNRRLFHRWGVTPECADEGC